MSIYHFMSTNTGELQTNFISVIKVTLFNLRKFHFLTRWSYNRKGF